jgi:uncharacterized membrane protein
MRLWVMALAAAGLVVMPSLAQAELRLCNYTDSRVGVAIGYKDKKGWVSEGWWTVEPTKNPDPKKCPTLIKGNLNARFYYVHAIDFQKGGSWSGTSRFCVRDKLFTVRGIQDCASRGYKQAGFYEIDTGEERDWIISLSSDSMKGGQPKAPQSADQQPSQ